MSFFQLVRREMHGSLNRLAVMSGLGGVSNAAILAAINSGAQAAGNGEVSVSSAALFVVALLLFIKTQHYILIATNCGCGSWTRCGTRSCYRSTRLGAPQ